MSSFVTRTYVQGPDVGLLLRHEEWLRSLYVGSNWSEIKIGLLWAIGDTGANLSIGNYLLAGVCSGTALPVGNATTTNFFGMQLGGQAGVWTYVANAGNAYYQTNINDAMAYAKVGSSVTQSASSASIFVQSTLASVSQRRALTIIDITKGTPNFTATVYYVPSANAASDYTTMALYTSIAQAGAPTFTPSLSTGTTGNLAFSESNGVLDTVNIYFNFPSTTVELYEVAVYKIA